MHLPLVSVLMTAYNREEYIGEAIESVLKSTWKNFELIVVDDFSSDNTFAIAKSYVEKDLRVKVYANEVNLGQFPNRNMAVSYACGEFIMHVDSDDTLFEDGIEKCVCAMKLFPQSSFGMLYYGDTKEPFLLESKEAIRSHFFKAPFLVIGPGGTIIRRTYLESIKNYPTNYGVPGDMYFNLKAASQSPIVMLPFEFHYYRRHEGQEINNHFSYLYNNYLYLKDALVNLNLYLTEKEKKWLGNKNNRRFMTNIVKYLFRSKNFSKTKEAMQRTGFGFRDALSGIFHFN